VILATLALIAAAIYGASHGSSPAATIGSGSIGSGNNVIPGGVEQMFVNSELFGEASSSSGAPTFLPTDALVATLNRLRGPFMAVAGPVPVQTEGLAVSVNVSPNGHGLVLATPLPAGQCWYFEDNLPGGGPGSLTGGASPLVGESHAEGPPGAPCWAGGPGQGPPGPLTWTSLTIPG